MTAIGTVIEGKYEILKEIGRGGMSIVYLAMDKHLNKQWAVKEIRKKGSGKNDEIVVNSLLAEANLMKRLDHPSLPRIVDIIDNGVTIYVIMDYIEGESLDKILAEYGSQSEELVINWAKQLCDALSYLHSQKPPIIYRDMKPANIMLKPEGNIKIIDFGIAREYKEQNLADTTVLGTKGYAPPEQYSGQTDARSDIFALGMTMHHLLTGVDPRNGEPYAPVRQWNPDLSEGIEIIIDRCVEPAAENRYQSCADLLYDLEHPELITKDFKKKQKRKLTSFIVAASMFIVMLISGILCSGLAKMINTNNYEAYIAAVDSIESYTEAIKIYPNDPRAYMKILETYEDNGAFAKKQNDQFLALYNPNKESFDSSNAEVVKLKYKIAIMYLNYYTKDDGSYSIGERFQKSYPFFEENYKNNNVVDDFEEKVLSDFFYQISSFYKKYMLDNSSVEEVSKNVLEELLVTIKSAIDTTDDYSAYNRMFLYSSVSRLFDDNDFIKGCYTANIKQDELQDILAAINSKAKLMNVQKNVSKELQKEITDKYESRSNGIARTYRNLEERG